jgi:ATP-dependent DNA helicase RecG
VTDATPLSRALSLSSARVGRALLDIREDQWFERKSGRISARDLATTLIAFANAEGGTVALGLHNGEVEGIDTAGRENEWRQAGIDHCEPAIKVAWRKIRCANKRGIRDHILVGEVAPSPNVHATPADIVYLRVGDENRRLSFAQRQELHYDKGQTHFDGSTVDEELQSLDLDQVLTYSGAIGSPDPGRALEARGLVREGRPTVAAWLLFAPAPQALFPSAYLRVIRYRGVTKESGRRQDIVEDLRLEGPIALVIEGARAAVERLEPHRRVLGPDGRFVVEGLIPQDAWLEGIVNAIVHRSYSLGGDHVRVEIFDDRIEVDSPGRFPGLTRISDFPSKVVRFARNPRIARACADLHFGQELGEGIRRMYEEMRLRGLAEPFYSETQAAVRLVLSSLVVGGRIVGQLKPELLATIDVVRQGQHLSTGEIADATRVSRPTAVARLRLLAEMGYIEWMGKSASDPRAYWRLRTE